MKHLALSGILAAGLLAWITAPALAQNARRVPAPAVDVTAPAAVTTKTAVFAGGCFWGVQAVFQHVNGVSNAVSGYAGGDAKSARYGAVSAGRTGHAEAVRITYEPTKISYGKLLQIYFSAAHDPTELNRQGPDTGTQYRSTVFAADAQEQAIASAYIAQLNRANTFGKPLATTVEMAKPFYAAEDEHQDYLVLHPNQPYIVINDQPKLGDLKRLFPEAYKATPSLVRMGKTG